MSNIRSDPQMLSILILRTKLKSQALKSINFGTNKTRTMINLQILIRNNEVIILSCNGNNNIPIKTSFIKNKKDTIKKMYSIICTKIIS